MDGVRTCASGGDSPVFDLLAVRAELWMPLLAAHNERRQIWHFLRRSPPHVEASPS
jgi:hypothetical protein